MPRNRKHERFVVTGPGIEVGQEPSYAAFGPALSRSLTAATEYEGDVEDPTFYVHDGVTDKILGHSARYEKVVLCVSNIPNK